MILPIYHIINQSVSELGVQIIKNVVTNPESKRDIEMIHINFDIVDHILYHY